MNKWWQILWGSRQESELEQKIRNSDGSPDPDELTIENAYKTRWIWYHTILGLLMFFANIVFLAFSFYWQLNYERKCILFSNRHMWVHVWSFKSYI